MPQRSDRANAIRAGILFFVATLFPFLGAPLYGPPLRAADVLATAAVAAARIRLGIMVEVACVRAVRLVAVALYPVRKRMSEALAIGHVAFRLFEAAVFASLEIDRLRVPVLSEACRLAPGADPATLQAMIAALIGGEAWTGVCGAIYTLGFVAGMLMGNAMFWTSRRVPRRISGRGLVSAAVPGTLAVTALFAAVPGRLAVGLIAPLAVPDLVRALWLVARGFDAAALARLR